MNFLSKIKESTTDTILTVITIALLSVFFAWILLLVKDNFMVRSLFKNILTLKNLSIFNFCTFTVAFIIRWLFDRMI